jgi:hypothetical protein
MRKLARKLNDLALSLYCRAQVARGVLADESGMSKLAITVILLAVGVSLTLAVIALIAPELLGLAERTAEDIGSVDLSSPGDW